MKRDSSETFSIFGVPIRDATCADAIAVIDQCLRRGPGRATTFYFANTHTLNLASQDTDYAAVLRRADYVFGDGTGVRWASRILRGIPPRENVNGTDLVPRILREFAGPGRRVFLLGAPADGIERAARFVEANFPGWDVVDFHHGYVHEFDTEGTQNLLERIRASRADVLLIGMGNPLQENWIDRHRDSLRAPVVLAIGGLFAYWSGDLDRAPRWMRRLGIEWLHLMIRQPRKTARYLLGNPAFLLRAWAERLKLKVYPQVEAPSDS